MSDLGMSALTERILAFIADKPATRAEIARACKCGTNMTRVVLFDLLRTGRIITLDVDRGPWRYRKAQP